MIGAILAESARALFSAADAAKELTPTWVPVAESLAKGEEPTTDDLFDLIWDNVAPKVKVGETEVTVDPTALGTLGPATYKEGKKNVEDYIENSPRASEKSIDRSGGSRNRYERDGKKYSTRDKIYRDGVEVVYNPETGNYEPVDE